MHVKAPSGSFHVRHRGAVFLDDSLPQKVLLSLLPPRSNNNNHNKKSNYGPTGVGPRIVGSANSKLGVRFNLRSRQETRTSYLVQS